MAPVGKSLERLPICPLTVNGECLVKSDIEKRRQLLEKSLEEGKLAKELLELTRVVKGSACEECRFVKELAKGEVDIDNLLKIQNEKEL